MNLSLCFGHLLSLSNTWSEPFAHVFIAVTLHVPTVSSPQIQHSWTDFAQTHSLNVAHNIIQLPVTTHLHSPPTSLPKITSLPHIQYSLTIALTFVNELCPNLPYISCINTQLPFGIHTVSSCLISPPSSHTYDPTRTDNVCRILI